jgi:hypothetical protein
MVQDLGEGLAILVGAGRGLADAILGGRKSVVNKEVS